ncbi:MAG: hypothetical protein LBU88_06065 [Treponema sp.]|nr:hypothetical protein [Treponema sp.]
MDHKIKIIFHFIVVIFLFTMFNACNSKPHPVEYVVLDINENLPNFIIENINSFNELVDKGSILNVEFYRFDNYKYSHIAIYLYTLEKYNNFKIHSFEFKFNGNNKIIKINENIKLDKEYYQEDILFEVEESDELSIKSYLTLIEVYDNNIKIDLHKIFNKKTEDIGEKIDLTLRVYYSFDNKDVLIQEINYIVIISEFREPICRD